MMTLNEMQQKADETDGYWKIQRNPEATIAVLQGGTH